MASPTMAARLLDAADTLLAEGRRSTAFRRRAVSTAYYAVFHALAKLCADYLSRSAGHSSNEFINVYRALEHRVLKTRFAEPSLKDNPRLARIGDIVAQLQSERHQADYMPPSIGLYSRNRTRELIDMAREAVELIEAIRPSQRDCRLLAISLHFRKRD